jgi:hypothetical protein
VTSGKSSNLQLIQALYHRPGRTTCGRPKFAKFCADVWKPIGALVIFLPVQLALFLSVKYDEHLSSRTNLSPLADHPCVLLEEHSTKDNPESKDPVLQSGRMFRSTLAVASPPLWPRDMTKFPFAVPASAQATINAFCSARGHYDRIEKTSLQGQLRLDPHPMSVKFHLAELPLRNQQQVSEDRSHYYTSDKSHSGPLGLFDRLCNKTSQEELQQYVNYFLLSPQAETVLSRSVDAAFPIDGPPEKKQKQARASSTRSQSQLTSRSSRSWQSSDWQDYENRELDNPSPDRNRTDQRRTDWHSAGWQESSSSSWQSRTWNWREK